LKPIDLARRGDDVGARQEEDARLSNNNDVFQLKVAITRLQRLALQNVSTTMHLIAAISQIDDLPPSAKKRVQEAMLTVDDQMSTLKELEIIIGVEKNEGEH